MNRTEALQAAFMIAGPNVTAEEHIQYAEFLLGDQNTIVLEDRISKVDNREYAPHEFIGDLVYVDNGDLYPTGAVALDRDRDVWYHDGEGLWTLYVGDHGSIGEKDNGGFPTVTLEIYEAVFVA